jgi:hypothetical protein
VLGRLCQSRLRGKKLIILSLGKVLVDLNAHMCRFPFLLVQEFGLEKKLDPVYLNFAVNHDLCRFATVNGYLSASPTKSQSLSKQGILFFFLWTMIRQSKYAARITPRLIAVVLFPVSRSP